jgi:flagellar biosynthetic protein FlhB
MAEDRDQRTEQATARKREKLVEEGQIIRSQDIASAAVVAASCLAIGFSFELMGRSVVALAQRIFRLVDARDPLTALPAELTALATLIVPLGAAALAAIIAGLAQSRSFSLEVMAPKFERLDPMTNLAQLMPNKQSAMELAKQIGKLVAIGYIAYRVIADALPLFATLSSQSPLAAGAAVAAVAGKLAFRVCLAFFIAAGADYWLARRRYLEDAMMSKDEVREEHKSQEGRPEVRQRMRRRMQAMAKTRAKTDVSTATVVVVNPTHYAVALRYLPEKDFAPLVIAKGLDDVALAMRASARRAGVPVVEQRPLARALFADGKVGRVIPVEQYRAVAEVIAYVMQLKARDAGPARGEA